MKKFLFLLMFSFQILVLHAQNDELILNNEVMITNKSLMEILKKQVLPRVVYENEGVLVSMWYDNTRKADILYIKKVSLLFISEEVWKSFDGFSIVGDVIIVFKNCKRYNMISNKANTIPLKVYPSDGALEDDGPWWEYEFKNGKFRLLDRILAY
ncbi:MAG: hypothetical protein J6Q34_05870 [Bacteroidales bacterium]|nr:hypothetical protein [Bacteroidales bacterium]